MKKSVRIRKALPGEKPGYYNKTAKFLKKAQMGMEVNSPSNDPQRLNAIYTNVYASLMSDITPDVIYSSLIGEYALDENTALMILRSALGKLVEEGKINPESLEGSNSQQNQKQEEQPSETQDRESQEEYDQRMSEDAEQDELAMSDEGYYDEEEAANNDNSHLDTEEEQQQQAFRFGGYRQDGGESDEDYSDYYDDSNQGSSPEGTVINQYNNPGQNKMEKPFSMEDLISMTPGIQGTQAVPGIEDYLGDYRPISESYGSMDYLPRAQYGLEMLPGLTRQVEKGIEALSRGYSGIRSLVPMTNASGIRKAFPVATLTGEALTKLPYVGPKLSPALKTTFTQNRNHLWEVLNGADPNKDIFGRVGTRTNPDGSLQVNRLLLYQQDLNKILSVLDKPLTETELSEGLPKVFKLGEIQPMAAADGLVSGVYPMDSKVTGGTDDQGNKFFELSYKFGPNQTLPFGSTSNKARELTFKNRFYYTTVVDPTTNQTSYKVFGPLGEELTPGTQTKYRIQRPFVSSVLRTEGETLLKDPNTPFPNFQVDFGRNPNGPFTSGVGRVDVTSTPPSTVDRLGFRGKIGRGLENFALSTYVPQIFGLGNPLRTSPKNVSTLELPVLGYTSSALGPNVINPALETGVASDIANAMNYKYRIGRNALIGAGGLGYLGYKTWDAFYNECQCDNPTGRNYMPKDEYGNCPCMGDVGDKRILDPTGQPIEQLAPQEQLTVPDSMKFLDEQGLYPTEQNYYRLKGKNKRSQAVDYKTGGITEKQFVKAFSSKFQDGGPQDQSLGKGKRMDTLTNDVEARKDIFKSKLKDNSNVALTKEIYKNAQSNPQILNMLMQDGPKENLAEDTGMQTAQFGGVPDWYTGYNTALSPKKYRKLYRQMKRMMPRGLDISRANMASNFYDNRFMQPGYGTVVTTPEYMNMLAMSSLPLYKSAANVYGGGRKPSELQADEATAINNEKGIPLLPEMTPDFIDSPIRSTGYMVPASDDAIEDFFKNKRAPIVGETWDTWYTSDGSTPGFAPDTRTWDGTQWVGPSPSERMQLENREQGGFVDMDAENPLVRFIYGGDETGYYEPEDLPMAEFGKNIMNKDLEQRVVGDKLLYNEWAEGEKEDFATTHPGMDFDTWKAGQAGKDDYKKYEDFYGKSLYDYTNFDDPNVNPNSNNTNNNTQNGKNCPQGYVWNATYNACIPVAQVTYNPRVVRGQSGVFRNLAPWNPAFGYAGSWTKQMSLPYQLGSGNPYMGQLTGAPAARYVTKKGIFGKPKKWIDIYDVGAADDILSNYDYVGPENINSYDNNNMQQTRQKSSGDRLDRRIARWDRRAARNEEEYEPMEGVIRNYENPDDFYNAINPIYREDAQFLGAGYTAAEDYKNKGKVRKVRDAEGNWYDRNDKMIPDKKAPSEVPGYYDKKSNLTKDELKLLENLKYFRHGGLHTYGPGGANDPNTNPPAWMSGPNPKQYGTYDGNMISQAPMGTTKGFDEFGNPVSQAPAFGIQPPAAASPENYYVKDQNPIKRNLVGVENKRKDMVNFDGQSLVNQANAGFRKALNLFDPEKKRQCGPGTTWNSDTQTCQPTDAMDIYATATEQDRGDWVDIGSKAGLYRYDQMGQDRSSRATFGQYGGYMQNGGFYDPYYEEDEEIIMTPEELEQFLAAGGQVEYL
jgi:hypothetical protein